MKPCAAMARASSTISSNGRLRSGPRLNGTMQYVHVFVGHGKIRGVLHLTKDAKKGYYGIKGHCKPVHHMAPPPRPVIFRHHEVRFIPRASSTGFGGASNEQANLPLIGGALAMIAGGLGVGVLARRRVSGALS